MSDLTLTFYEEDGETVYFEVGTAADHANPYLCVPESSSEAEIDLLRGTARIGRTRVRVIDPQTGASQSERFFTALLGSALGYSEINGRRAVLQHVTGEIVQDGVCSGVSLTPTYAGFIVDLDDVRVRGIDVPAFNRTGTATVFPRGVRTGYGALPTGHLLPPTEPLSAVYRVTGTGAEFDVAINPLFMTDARKVRNVHTRHMDRASTPVVVERNGRAVRVHRDVEIWWRGSSAGDWFQLRDIEAASEGVATPSGYTQRSRPMFLTRESPSVFTRFGIRSEAHLVTRIWAGKHGDGQTRPLNNAPVEVMVVYVGPASEDYPFHFEGDCGVFIRNLLRGDYSTDEGAAPISPGLRYDEALLTDPAGPFGFPIRVRQTEPVEDLREYLEDICRSIGAAPALDELGRIAPVLSDLPAPALTLAEINDSNAQPSAGWEHPITDAVTQVEYRYGRDVIIDPLDDVNGERSGGDGIVAEEQPVTVKPSDPSIQTVMGVKPLTIDGFLLRSAVKAPFSGDVTSEAGFQFALEFGHAVLDRFAYGGQTDFVRVMRSDPDMAAVRVGDWLVDGRSWSPNYATGERGRNHLVQVVSIRDVNPAWREMRLIDAAPYANPVGQPTRGTVTASADGVVSVPITAIPAGAEARVDYAVSATVPLASSGLWTFVGRTATTGTLATPAVPAGSTVWIRARGEQIGRRASAWTTPVSVTVPGTPRILAANLRLAEDGTPQLEWSHNAFVAGVRAYYIEHPPLGSPGTPTLFVDFDADDLGGDLPLTVTPGQALTVTLVPYTGWSGIAATGTAGDDVILYAVAPIGEADGAASVEAIIEKLARLASQRAAIYGTHAQLVGNARLTGAPRTALIDAWDAFDDAHQALVGVATLAIADQILDPSERSAIYMAEAAMAGTIEVFHEAAANAVDAIKDATVDESVGEAVSDVTALISPLGAIIRSATAPTTRPGGAPLQTNDLWVNTAGGYSTPYSWDGTQWVVTSSDASAIFGMINVGVVFAGELQAAFGTFRGTVQVDTDLDENAIEFLHNGNPTAQIVSIDTGGGQRGFGVNDPTGFRALTFYGTEPADLLFNFAARLHIAEVTTVNRETGLSLWFRGLGRRTIRYSPDTDSDGRHYVVIDP